MTLDVVRRAREAFRLELSLVPPLSLRGADAVDSYENAPAFDAQLDAPTDAYLERYGYWALPHLDPTSWRHYLPRFIEYARTHASEASNVMDAVMFSLHPPDRVPPRFGSLTVEQVAVVRAFLEALARNPDAVYRDNARRALEEYWRQATLGPP